MERLILTGNSNVIKTKINNFRHLYHEGFKDIRTISNLHFFCEESTVELEDFARRIKKVLKEWKAGCQNSPDTKDIEAIIQALISNTLKRNLNNFSDGSWIASKKTETDELKTNLLLIDLLKILASNFFVGNKTITYPTKLLLLFTGRFVGVDSKVRCGLTNCGIGGYSSTFTVPKEVTSNEAKKLIRLNNLLTNCWIEYKDIFLEGVTKSNHRYLLSHLDSPARIFDILLFNDGSAFRYEI